MTYPIAGGSGGMRDIGPIGYTYAGIFVRQQAAGRSQPPGRPLDALRRARFTGWVAPARDGWVVAVPAIGDGTVASGRRGVVDLAQALAAELDETVAAVRVLADRQLLLAVWEGGQEVGRYVSDPSHGLPDDDDTLPDPLGVEHAEAFAAACGRPEAGEDLAEMLAEELDPDSVIESERLAGVLRLLGLPGWLVAASALPRDVPAGPRARDLVRLGAGADGVAGLLRGRATDVVRRRLRPPSPITDAPRGPGEIEPWML
jgi:hypothetical protein